MLKQFVEGYSIDLWRLGLQGMRYSRQCEEVDFLFGVVGYGKAVSDFVAEVIECFFEYQQPLIELWANQAIWLASLSKTNAFCSSIQTLGQQFKPFNIK
jgi:hypothetical protein